MLVPNAQTAPALYDGCVPIALAGRYARSPADDRQRTLRRTGVDLNDRLAAGLQARATICNCPLPTLMYAAFTALLQRITGETVFCTALPGGPDLPIDLGENPTLSEVLERAQAVIAAAADADVFGNAIRPAPSIAFDLALGWASTVDGAETRDADVFEICVHCERRDDGLRVWWCYDPGVYDARTIAHAAAQYERVLEAFAGSGDIALACVPLMSTHERTDVVAQSQGEARPYERDATIAAVWASQVRRSPDTVAVADERTELTYGQVDRRANAFAHYLQSIGVGCGTTVGVAFDRSIDLPVTLLAILKAGGVYVPLDPGYPVERLDFMIADAAIAFIVSRAPLAVGLRYTGQIIRIDAHRIDPTQPVEPLQATGDAADCAYITYTSGSTGRPKGVAVTQRGVLRLVRSMDYVDITSDDGYLQHAPLAFDASTFEIWAPLLNGARLSIPRPGLLSMPDVAAVIERLRVTTLFLTTSLFGRLVDSRLPAFQRLRYLLTGGDVGSPAQMGRFIEQYPRCRLIAVYGPTENTTFSTALALATPAAIGTRVPIGTPIGNSSAYVVDARGDLAASGVAGELWVGGDGVAAGYLNLPELSAQRFCSDPFSQRHAARVYKTGDRVVRRPDGVLEFLGRMDNQVKIRGFRVEPGEIEAALCAQAGVRSAAVVAAVDGEDKALFAFVTLIDPAAVDEGALRMRLTAMLPQYLLPKRISIVNELPEHASGKIDRVALARRAADPPIVARTAAQVIADARPAARPVSAERQLQQTVAEIWRATLHLAGRPDIDQNFFDAGGDSLRLLSMHADLEKQLHTQIPIMELFEHSTIRKLAVFLAAAQSR